MKTFYTWIVVLILFAVLVIYMNKQSEDEDVQLKKYPGETVGTIYKYGGTTKGSPMVWYQYDVDGKTFSSWSGLNNFGNSRYDSSHIGEKYKVIYSKKDPRISKIDFENQVKDK